MTMINHVNSAVYGNWLPQWSCGHRRQVMRQS